MIRLLQIVCRKLCVGIQVEFMVAQESAVDKTDFRNSQITKQRAHGIQLQWLIKYLAHINLQNTLNRNGILVLIRNLDSLNISLQPPNYTHSIIILKKAQARNNSSHCIRCMNIPAFILVPLYGYLEEANICIRQAFMRPRSDCAGPK